MQRARRTSNRLLSLSYAVLVVVIVTQISFFTQNNSPIQLSYTKNISPQGLSSFCCPISTSLRPNNNKQPKNPVDSLTGKDVFERFVASEGFQLPNFVLNNEPILEQNHIDNNLNLTQLLLNRFAYLFTDPSLESTTTSQNNQPLIDGTSSNLEARRVLSLFESNLINLSNQNFDSLVAEVAASIDNTLNEEQTDELFVDGFSYSPFVGSSSRRVNNRSPQNNLEARQDELLSRPTRQPHQSTSSKVIYDDRFRFSKNPSPTQATPTPPVSTSTPTLTSTSISTSTPTPTITSTQTSRQTTAPADSNPEYHKQQQQSQQLPNYFRVLDRVFSRVRLPEVFKHQAGRPRHGYCANFLGCLEEIPNLSSLIRKPNVSATFTIYNGRTQRIGKRIHFSPIIHYQLQDANSTTENQVHNDLRRQYLTAASSTNHKPYRFRVGSSNIANNHHHHNLGYFHDQQQYMKASPTSPLSSGSISSSSPSGAQLNMRLQNYNNNFNGQILNHRHGHNRSYMQKQNMQQQASNLSPKHQHHPPISWRSAAKVSRSQEYPFDMSLLETSGFNASQPTRVIVGGYFAKENESWIEDVVKAWMSLQQDSNIIKVSWADANRGLYHTAAYNSRIVGRQMTLFLHYLDQLFNIDLSKFHLVGHSLGAHIAGFVGSDLSSSSEGKNKLARITGLDPAGPIFVDLDNSMRLDTNDAIFVDVIHTNAGPILKGALGLTAPTGHVDYFPNGNSQPGCYFSSMSKSIADPVERVACNHRRSYRYFIEIIKLTAQELAGSNNSNNNNTQNDNIFPERSVPDSRFCKFDFDQVAYTCDKSSSQADSEALLQGKLPQAFLFEVKNLDELTKLTQPDLLIMQSQLLSSSPIATTSSLSSASSLSSTSYSSSNLPLPSNVLSKRRFDVSLAPMKKPIEFHTFKPNFPFCCQRGLYYFKTRSEAPFFGGKQHALTIKFESPLRRKINMSVKLDQIIVAESEIDETQGPWVLIFVPNESSIGLTPGEDKIPQLSLMWKYRSFNLLQQSNELNLNSLQLSLLDVEQQEPLSVTYNTILSQTINPSLSSSTSSSTVSPLPQSFSSSSSSSTESNLNFSMLDEQQSPGEYGSRRVTPQHLSASLLSSGVMPVSFLPLKLFRNQWYKFNGYRATSKFGSSDGFSTNDKVTSDFVSLA